MREFIEKAFGLVGIEIAWEGEHANEVGKDKKTGIVRVRIDEKVLTYCKHMPFNNISCD